MVRFKVLTKFMNNQKTHVVELEFFEFFLPYSFRLFGLQTKQGNIHPFSAEIGLKHAAKSYMGGRWREIK